MKTIKIIGAGLSGSEAALQLADSGWKVKLFEMRPKLKTPAHETDKFAEIVCSNSLKSKLRTTASGLLKEEMKMLGCKLLPIAENCSVPAGIALAVDREKFSHEVTKIISDHPNIDVIRKEFTEIDDELTIVATGPLTSSTLTQNLIDLIGKNQLYFFDAIAPIIDADSIDRDIVYRKTRYDKGEADYLNCPFSRDEYYDFVTVLNNGQKHEAHEFETQIFEDIKFQFYENCTPIEELVRRGKDTLRFGVMRPVGLEDPKTDKRPFAAFQLRAENTDKTAYNLVGCQTMLKYGDQKKILRKIPGLQYAEFLRFGSIHRNTFLNGPKILNPDLSLQAKPNVFIAGQLAGVEGYVESILGGILVARNVKQTSCLHSYGKGVSLEKTASIPEFRNENEKIKILKSDCRSNSMILPETTVSGQLWRHLITPVKNFQPMNANFGLLPPLIEKIKDKKLKKQKLADRSLKDLKQFLFFNGN
ncbi:MAG: methylenetetrahydrofolate--tRNA-(uracil(54)-C(5))-methyltransferase (FADH(2)-oxidizing) TrmFO [Candidatus Cloacimonetes bacterium]|nr:methylenetetrahydrofolate--tRNA-(uracil(54)-C(5))-methyltransferase (FADH(2)-oxidizing) TrmFO [Candidatus Cloacimonadota bacterium]MCF7813489.1 methylenetetrahydrofolate--tRNA-(uracil(54)-C(5))-methyltransferase (FADH(2)-oxidizing) TrmFO [Candidatus Cloacimonadota bacterium]MCF7868588.1 methylenetetrahydrofolate--tRNA-(uracil(54)-C(5))-methyltransferase (FADH(2)-oxidizing) TrmFO [Candidatus Cloacimonadota bacterium]MCF7883375.1 methylenetetrahydrofolate--tRNA-(uracil(54)-C(5))-methyltransfera